MPSNSTKNEFYLGNPNLPNKHWKGEYTKEMVNHLKKSKQNLLHFAENFFYIIDPDAGKVCIELFPYQKRCLRTIRDNRKAILLASRQVGKTTVLTIYALWISCFNDYQNIVIVANKEATAIEIFRRIRLAYEELPNWIKPGVKEYGKTSCEFENGSRISISTTTGSAARGASINCVEGKTKITLRDKDTGNIFETSMEGLECLLKGGEIIPIIKFMADLLNPICVSNKKYEVLTDEGFKDFKGLLIGDNPNRLEITINNTIKLRCTPKHKLVSSDKSIVYAENIDIGYVLYNNYIITDKRAYTDTDKVYELLEVKDTHRYFTNNILSHQCIIIDEMAFIEPESILEDFWRSVFPTISRSKKSKVLIASTPNGTGNLFHRLVDGAEKNENGFVYERVIWSEVPGRDEKWKQEQLRALGSMESFLQEYECQFLSLGDSSIDEELFYDLSQKCTDAKIILDDGHYKIWEEPDPSRVYVAGVDISEGVGVDASVIQILDITDIRAIKQVAVYHNRQIPPLEFANKLYSILRNWGSPLALIERNNCGAQVVDRLAFDMGYEKVVSYGSKVANRVRPQMGMVAHTNTKYKGIINMRYFVNEVRVVEFRDIDTLKEFKDFVRHPNGTWKAKSGSHDDRVMSFLYALYILEKELTERYFDIVELDDQGKPLLIEPMDFGIAMFENPTSIYLDNEVVGINTNAITPIVFGGDGSEQLSEMDDLISQGWKPYGS